MSLNQPLLLSSALVHQVLLSPTTYPYKQVFTLPKAGARGNCDFWDTRFPKQAMEMTEGGKPSPLGDFLIIYRGT